MGKMALLCAAIFAGTLFAGCSEQVATQQETRAKKTDELLLKFNTKRPEMPPSQEQK